MILLGCRLLALLHAWPYRRLTGPARGHVRRGTSGATPLPSPRAAGSIRREDQRVEARVGEDDDVEGAGRAPQEREGEAMIATPGTSRGSS